ncbi:MAG: LpxI family protein [Opitutae bacterium]|nr:LpxI family protein [Opitutae bacterium]MCD8298505.1 LpxI family protein [Opitutae bacterium]
MISRFLPADFDPTAELTLLSGKGAYPRILAARAREAGVPLSLIAIVDEVDDDFVATFPPDRVMWAKVGQLGKFLSELKILHSRYFIMCGRVAPKRLFHGLVPDLKAALALAKLKERNAHTIFGAIADEAERNGVIQLDSRAFMDDELATEGAIVGKASKISQGQLEYGIRIAKECARLDIGQGVVVAGGTVTAVEAYEGTDKMLRRCADIPKKNPLFVKTVKPKHDYRFDVPCFGMRTLDSLEIGGIKHVALQADNVVILEKQKVLEEARRRGITIIGYRVDDQ